MITRFDPLCTLEITHGYYDGRCRDFTFVVPDDTARTLAGGRMMARALEGKLHVLIEKDAEGQPIVSPGGRTLRFGLRLDNACFANFTELAFSPWEFAALYSNSAEPRVLGGPAPVRLLGAVVRHALQSATRPLTVTVRSAGASVVRVETLNAADGRSSVSFDLSGLAPGAVVIEEAPAGEAAAESACYFDPALASQAAFGAVEIAVAESFLQQPAEFRIAFAARAQQLKYYLVARRFSEAEVAQLTVSDAGFAAAARPEVVFDRVAAAKLTAEDLPREILEDGEARVVLFRSRRAVGRRQGGLRKIRLQKNGDTLIENLPHPRPDSASADLIVHVSKP